jgi:hypothetical protein
LVIKGADATPERTRGFAFINCGKMLAFSHSNRLTATINLIEQ